MISKLAANVTVDPLIYPEEEYYPVSEIRTSGTMLFSYAHCAGREGSFHYMQAWQNIYTYYELFRAV